MLRGVEEEEEEYNPQGLMLSTAEARYDFAVEVAVVVSAFLGCPLCCCCWSLGPGAMSCSAVSVWRLGHPKEVRMYFFRNDEIVRDLLGVTREAEVQGRRLWPSW